MTQNVCSHCGQPLETLYQFWCGEWEEVELCPTCDIATDEDSGIMIRQ